MMAKSVVMRKRPGTERENKIMKIKNHAFGKKKVENRKRADCGEA